MSKQELNDDLEIEAELNDPEINNALSQSKKEIECGQIGTETDIFNILREKK